MNTEQSISIAENNSTPTKVLDAKVDQQQIACRPFIKWAGSKRSLLNELKSRLPLKFARYYEPFVGSGALFFQIQRENSFLSDINVDLINAYQVIKNQVLDLIADLQKHEHTAEYYYRLRDLDRSSGFESLSTVERASRFIFLNKTCFNGLYRVNSKGQFNVPFGAYENVDWVKKENLFACSKLLSSAEIQLCPFEAILQSVQPQDFVYLDPPYIPLSKTANFTAYNSEGFSIREHEKLSNFCNALDQRKAYFMLSNSFVGSVVDLFNKFNVEIVFARRAINSKAELRGKIKEVIIRNY